MIYGSLYNGGPYQDHMLAAHARRLAARPSRLASKR
jgi:hypothetical protein